MGLRPKQTGLWSINFTKAFSFLCVQTAAVIRALREPLAACSLAPSGPKSTNAVQDSSAALGTSSRPGIIGSFSTFKRFPSRVNWKVSFLFVVVKTLTIGKWKRNIYFQLTRIFICPARGCAAAAVRVWKRLDEPPVEICGEKLKQEHEMFLSEGNAMKVT